MTGSNSWIQSPDDPRLDELCALLDSRADAVDITDDWPREQLAWFSKFGVWSWFVPSHRGGQEWDDASILRAYLKLGKACLTTTFITTQWSAGAKRLMSGDNDRLKSRFSAGLLSGDIFTTIGISHLTTSRRHLAKPVLAAREDGDDYILDGFSPWVTGGAYSHVIVTGAVLPDGDQILVALPTDLPGVEAQTPLKLVGLSASKTGQVNLDSVRIPKGFLLGGPTPNVLVQGAGTQTGGLQTSTLALASAAASIELIEREAERRPDLHDPGQELRDDYERQRADLFRLADGESNCTPDEARARANSLALRSSQAALAAAKGSGYVWGHRAGRYCREALFFLVWSCPQPVVMANLCELAGLSD